MNEFDINYNEIEDLEYCLQLLEKRDKEIERLNNIINELEKYLDSMWLDDKGIVLRIKDKLQQLKGSDKE